VKEQYHRQPCEALAHKFLQHHQKEKTLSPNQKLERAHRTTEGSTSTSQMVEGGGDAFLVQNEHEQKLNTTSPIHRAENTLNAKSAKTLAK
jgi:hypothetical protein